MLRCLVTTLISARLGSSQSSIAVDDCRAMNRAPRFLVHLLISTPEFRQDAASCGDSLELLFTEILPGSFRMGSSNGQRDERPVHEVTLYEALRDCNVRCHSEPMVCRDENHRGPRYKVKAIQCGVVDGVILREVSAQHIELEMMSVQGAPAGSVFV